MTITSRWITEADAEAALTASVWRRICDDDADGAADENPGQRLISNAEAFVSARVKGVFDYATLVAQGKTGVAEEFKRICLDVLTAFAIRRHPSYVRGDWRAILAEARIDLRELRLGDAQLDTAGAPQPAANTRGYVRSGDEDDTTPEEHTFLGPSARGEF